MKKRMLFLIIFLIMVTSVSGVCVYSFINEKNTEKDYKAKIDNLNADIINMTTTIENSKVESDALKEEKLEIVEEYDLWEKYNQKILESLD